MAEDLVEVTSLFDRDLEELANDDEALDKIVSYLRQQRDNVRTAEAAGKRVTKKVATGETPTKKVKAAEEPNPMEKLL